jgi:hypothetical protein
MLGKTSFFLTSAMGHVAKGEKKSSGSPRFFALRAQNRKQSYLPGKSLDTEIFIVTLPQFVAIASGRRNENVASFSGWEVTWWCGCTIVEQGDSEYGNGTSSPEMKPGLGSTAACPCADLSSQGHQFFNFKKG